MNLEILGTFIHNKREEVGIPLAKAAQKAGIGRSTLWILEQGKNPKTGKPSRPSKDILERLAQAFHMSQEELEKALALADYTVARQPMQTLGKKEGATQQSTLSQPVTITEINGTVYYAHDGYLEAFEAKTGNHLWYTPSGVSPLESSPTSVSRRVEQVRVSLPPHTVKLEEPAQEILIRKPQNAAKEYIREQAEFGLLGTWVGDQQTPKSASNKVGHIIKALRERIVSGELERGGRLPALRSLKIEYQTTQKSINKALLELQAEGWISRDSKGYFVMSRIELPGLPKNPSDPVIEAGLEPVEEYIEDVKVLHPPINIGKNMNLKKNAPVVRRFRKFGIPNEVYRISDTYFPKVLVSEEMLRKMNDPSYDVLPEIKSQTGKFIKHVHETFITRFPTQDEQDWLKIAPSNPVIELKRSNYSPDKKTVVMFNHVVLNANLFMLSYDYTVNFWG